VISQIFTFHGNHPVYYNQLMIIREFSSYTQKLTVTLEHKIYKRSGFWSEG